MSGQDAAFAFEHFPMLKGVPAYKDFIAKGSADPAEVSMSDPRVMQCCLMSDWSGHCMNLSLETMQPRNSRMRRFFAMQKMGVQLTALQDLVFNMMETTKVVIDHENGGGASLGEELIKTVSTYAVDGICRLSQSSARLGTGKERGK